MRLEDYSVDMRRHLEAVFTFVGLRQPTEAEWQAILGAPAANVGARRRLSRLEQDTRRRMHRGHDMLPHTRAKLEIFYAPFNKRLAETLREPRFEWAAQ
jgi:hypothetical protein